MKLVNNLDFNKYEARNIKLQNLAAAPSSPTPGQAYFDTSLNKPRVWDGTAWQDMVSGAPAAHTHSASDITAGTFDIARLPVAASGTSNTTQVVRADDARLSNARTPTAHVHAIGDVTGLQGALDGKLDDSQLGAANGVASLDAGGKVPSNQLPSIAFTNVEVVASIAARDALTGMAEGDVAIVNGDRSYIWTGTAWEELDSATDGVQTVLNGTGITIGGTAANPTVNISNGGVTETQLAASVAGTGLTGGGGAALAVNPGTGLENSGDTVRIAAAAAGNGLTGGAGSALAVGQGTGISVTADAVAIDTAVVVRKASFNVGDGAATSYVLTHNLGTRDVQVTVYTNSAPYDEVLADVEHTDANTVTVRFAAAPAASAYRATVQG